MELSEKAILGLECCLETIDDESCPEICPYYSECMKHEKRCIFQYVMRDALSVLKAQDLELSRLKNHVDCEAAETTPAGCVGYGRGFNDDEPCETCKKCEKYNGYGEE